MMRRSLEQISRFVARFRYPVTLPEDVTEALGVEVSNFLPYDKLIECIDGSCCNPLCLSRFMPRREAEAAFAHATYVERFGEKTIVSYFFHQGWIEFVMFFDGLGRLRRVYLLHKGIDSQEGREIDLLESKPSAVSLPREKASRTRSQSYTSSWRGKDYG